MKNINKLKLLALAALMFIGGKNANAQLEQSVYLNAGLPTADFHQKVTSSQLLLGKDFIGMDAAMGLGAGYRAGYIFDIGFGEITPFVNADLIWNQIRGERRDNYATSSIKTPKYYNIPLMLGVNYRYELTDIITVFGELGFGYDMFIATAEGKKDDPMGYYKYKVGGATAWQIGAGSYFGNHFSIGLHYYGLGKHTVNYNYDKSTLGAGVNPITYADKNPQLRRIGTFAIRLGFHF